MTRRCVLGLRAVCLSALLFAWPHCLATAQASDWGIHVVRVEQDWQLTVSSPDQVTDAPQVITIMSPTGDLQQAYSAFMLNEQSVPTYAAGGVQLQVWEGRVPLAQSTAGNGAILATDNETITWTETMAVADGQLVFTIVNGNSATWGNFGGQGELVTSVPTTLTNLNGYRPWVSIQNSGIAFAANRVQSLVLKRIRVVLSTGDQFEFDEPQTIYPPSSVATTGF